MRNPTIHLETHRRLRKGTIIVTALVTLLVCIFPPREWADDIHTSYSPSRGFLFRPAAPAKDWQSPHMYLARTARTDYLALAWQAGSVLAAGGALWLVLIWMQKRTCNECGTD
jgi:hypothetical protein